MIFFIIIPGAIGLIFIYWLLFFVMTDKNDDFKPSENVYPKPKLKELTAEQIEDIHSRGNITPAEQVEEWEAFGLCAPGDAIGSAAWRCKKFRCCHDCLIDYANDCDEYTPFAKCLEESYRNIFIEDDP